MTPCARKWRGGQAYVILPRQRIGIVENVRGQGSRGRYVDWERIPDVAIYFTASSLRMSSRARKV